MNSQNHLQNLLNRNRLPTTMTIQILGLVVQREVILDLEEVEKVLPQGAVVWQPLEGEVKTNSWIWSKYDV